MQGSRTALISAIDARDLAAIHALLARFEQNIASLKWYKLKLRYQIQASKKLVNLGLKHALFIGSYEAAFSLSMHLNPDQALELAKTTLFEIDPNSASAKKAIFYAIAQADILAVSALLKRGIDPNLTDESGSTLLHRAVLTKNIGLVARLLQIKSGININALDAQENTPLMLATSLNSAEISTLFLRRGAKMEIANHKGETVFDLAKKNKSHVLAREIETLSNTQKLDQAVRNNDLDAAQAILSRPVHINKVNAYKMTALMEAARRGNLAMLKLLHEAGANINVMYKDNTALMLATVENHREAMKYLLEHGAAVDAKTRKGNTALLRAASMRCEMDTIILLRRYGASLITLNNKSESLLSIAKKLEYTELLDYIRQAPPSPPSPALSVNAKQPIVHFSLSPRRLEFNPLSPTHISPASMVFARQALSPMSRKCRTPYPQKTKEI
jgi:ankyrin repeat protein